MKSRSHPPREIPSRSHSRSRPLGACTQCFPTTHMTLEVLVLCGPFSMGIHKVAYWHSPNSYFLLSSGQRPFRLRLSPSNTPSRGMLQPCLPYTLCWSSILWTDRWPDVLTVDQKDQDWSSYLQSTSGHLSVSLLPSPRPVARHFCVSGSWSCGSQRKTYGSAQLSGRCMQLLRSLFGSIMGIIAYFEQIGGRMYFADKRISVLILLIHHFEPESKRQSMQRK